MASQAYTASDARVSTGRIPRGAIQDDGCQVGLSVGDALDNFEGREDVGRYIKLWLHIFIYIYIYLHM